MNLFLHTAKKTSHSILIVINEYKTEPDLCSTDIIWNPLCDNVNVILQGITKQNGQH